MRASCRNKVGLVLLLVLIAVHLYAPAAFAAVASLMPLAFVGDTSTTTDLDEAMKIIFEDTVVNNVVTDSELMDAFEEGGGIQTDTTTGGRYIETAQLFNLPAGVGARSEGDYIPVPSGPEIRNGRVYLKKIMGTLEMTNEVLKRVRSSLGAYLDWGEQAFPKLLERVTNEVDRMALGYGLGAKARVNAAVPALNLVVDSPLGLTFATNPGVESALLQFLAGETLKASPDTNPANLRAQVVKVLDVDFANGYIKVDSVAGLVDNDYLFPADSGGHSVSKEFMGLFGHVDDGNIIATYQNILRSDWNAWRSTIVNAQAAPFAAGQKLTEEVIVYADKVAYTRGGAKINLFVTSRDGADLYWKDLKSSDRVINDPRSYTGGRAGVFVLLGDRLIPLRVARKMPANVAFGITTSTLKKYMLHKWEWDRTTGAIWRQVTDANGRKDAFYAYGSMYLEMGGSDPQKNFKINNFALV
jgi:hypothetical protein